MNFVLNAIKPERRYNKQTSVQLCLKNHMTQWVTSADTQLLAAHSLYKYLLTLQVKGQFAQITSRVSHLTQFYVHVEPFGSI